MLLPNTNAVLLLLMIWYFMRLSRIHAAIEVLLTVLRPGFTKRPALPAVTSWSADLLWLPVLAYVSQPTIAEMVVVYGTGNRPIGLLLAMGVGFVVAEWGAPVLLRMVPLEDKHVL